MPKLTLVILFFPIFIFAQNTLRWEKLNHNLPSKIEGFSTDDAGNIFACTRRGIHKSEDDGQNWTDVKLFNTEGRFQNLNRSFFDDTQAFFNVEETNLRSSRPCDNINQGDFGSRYFSFTNGKLVESNFIKATFCVQGQYSGGSGPYFGAFEFWGDGIVKASSYTTCYARYTAGCDTNDPNISYDNGVTWQTLDMQTPKVRIFKRKNGLNYTLLNDSILDYSGVKKSIPIDKNQAFLDVFYQNNTILYCQNQGKYLISKNDGATWQTDSFRLSNIKGIKKVGDTLIVQNTEGWFVADFNKPLDLKPLFLNNQTQPVSLVLLQKIGSKYVGQTSNGDFILSKNGGKDWAIVNLKNFSVPNVGNIYVKGDSLLAYVKEFGWYFTKNDSIFKPFTPTENLVDIRYNYYTDTFRFKNKAISNYWYSDIFTTNNFQNTLTPNLPFKNPRFNAQNLLQCASADGYAIDDEKIYCFANLFGIYKTKDWRTITCQSYQETPTIKLDTMCRLQYRIFFGDTIRTEGSYSKNLKSTTTGCDSLVQLKLTVRNNQSYYQEYTCSNSPFILFKGDTIFSPFKSVYTYLKSDVNGCDTTDYLYVYFQKLQSFKSDTICKGHPFIVNDKDTAFVDDQATFYRNLKTKEGCDSVEIVSVKVKQILNPKLIKKEISHCDFVNGIYNFYGRKITQQKSYPVYEYSPDCNSDTVIQLIIKPQFLQIFTEVTVTINAGDTVKGYVFYNDSEFWLTYRNYTGSCDSIVITHVIVKPITTGIAELNNDMLKIQPNPATDLIKIDVQSINLNDFDKFTLQIVDILGKIQNSYPLSKFASIKEISVLGLVNGLYFVQLVDGRGRVMANSKVVVAH